MTTEMMRSSLLPSARQIEFALEENKNLDQEEMSHLDNKRKVVIRELFVKEPEWILEVWNARVRMLPEFLRMDGAASQLHRSLPPQWNEFKELVSG